MATGADEIRWEVLFDFGMKCSLYEAHLYPRAGFDMRAYVEGQLRDYLPILRGANQTPAALSREEC